MKKFLFILIFAYFVQPASAQFFSTNYGWADSVGISTTAVDTLFAQRWEQVSIWSDVDWLIKDGTLSSSSAVDTTNWSSRKWIPIKAYQIISFGTATKLVRMEYKSSSASGSLYRKGYKKTAQY